MQPIPIARPFLGGEEEEAVTQVLRTRWLTNGPKILEFEQAFAAWVGAPHAVAVSSGTTALHLALVGAGVKPGDDVICPSLSFIATANAIVHAGARPRFADVDEGTLNLTPETVAAALTPRTRGVMIVHQVGLPADVQAIAEAAPNTVIIEDAACAVGAELRGVRIGKPHGVLACFSFHPRKVMTTGEGGMITTADASIAERLRLLRNHGAVGVGHPYEDVGWNYRMSDVQAAIGIVQLSRLDAMLSRRRTLAANYARFLPDGVERPVEPPDRRHAFQSYVVRLRGVDRSTVIRRMAELGVQTLPGVMASHREAAHTSATVRLPVTDALADEILALPLYHELGQSDQERVAAALATTLA